MKNLIKYSLLVPFLALGVGCSPSAKDPKTQLSSAAQGLFSDRPVTQPSFVAMIKLKTPPLLTALKEHNGKSVVDPDLKLQIDQEQARVLEALAKVSSEIRVLYTYRMVINGMAVVVPKGLEEQVKNIANVVGLEKSGHFSRPEFLKSEHMGLLNVEENKRFLRNSVNFIQADLVHQKLSKRGENIHVGVLDTGIDYTHSMFMGPGDAEVFKATNPNEPSPLFPNAKVVGGVDLVGTDYDAGSDKFAFRIPKPDANPIDEGGHGTHVAGSIAGLGDGVHTYSGVAPGALLHSIKVFGADGSTSDYVVIAGLEYAADPNKDGDISDKLHVVNLSLGSGYGNPQILYKEAVQSLTDGGIVVVASAGNSGPRDYITGAPAVVDDALSVAASIDHSDHNWRYAAIAFRTQAGEEYLAELVEGTISLPVSEAGDVQGLLVYVGLADKDFSEEIASELEGKIALIDRGAVPFSDKVRRAYQAKALGVIVANNQPGDPIPMGGEGKYPIPAVMVSQSLGDLIKSKMKQESVNVFFKTDVKLEKPEKLDTLTSFTSKGPRSIDSHLKPEISAPGFQIISADMGQGSKGIPLSGTSMAAPHMAGVIALLRQVHPNLTARELKNLAMGTAKTLDVKGEVYPLSLQGSGRVQTLRAAEALLVANKAAFSLGEVTLVDKKTTRESVVLKSLSAEDLELDVEFYGSQNIQMKPHSKVKLPSLKSVHLELDLNIFRTQDLKDIAELDGWILIKNNNQEVYRIPVLAVVKNVSALKASELKVLASKPQEGAKALAELKVSNSLSRVGEVQLFNLLGQDLRKQESPFDPFLFRGCDLQAVGYRVISTTTDSGREEVLQIVGKIYEPLTRWSSCELSALVDSNQDGEPDQEIALINPDRVEGVVFPQPVNILVDATMMRQVRKDFEEKIQAGEKAKLDYKSSVLDARPAKFYNHGTIAILEVKTSLLKKSNDGSIRIKVGTSDYNSRATEVDDFFNKGAEAWHSISLDSKDQGFILKEESYQIRGGETKTLSFEKGLGAQPLMVLYPNNPTILSNSLVDSQIEVLNPSYQKD